MPQTNFSTRSVARRGVLGALATGVVASLLRPLRANEAADPLRLLVVHRPCGSVLEQFFPDASTTNLVGPLPFILSPLESLKQDLVVLRRVTCPREPQDLGDAHAAGMIGMMTGRRAITIPGTDNLGDPNAKNIVAADVSIDQHLAATKLVSPTTIASLQTTAYQPSSVGLPSFKVLSYSGSNQPLFPQLDAAAVSSAVFGAPLDDAQQRKLDDLAVLDCVSEDLQRVYGLVPGSQKPKLDTHLAALRQLGQQLEASECEAPELAPLPDPTELTTRDEAEHLTLAKNQLAIIKAAFQCDLTRVATFSFADGFSALRFKQMTTGIQIADSHHGLSHNWDAASDLARIDQVYCEVLAELLQSMKAVEEGAGTLLDNTLVVYLSECAIGVSHDIENMPVLLAGGKNWGLRTGQQFDCGGKYMNDVWAAACGAVGLEARFGASEFSTTPVSGLFG